MTVDGRICSDKVSNRDGVCQRGNVEFMAIGASHVTGRRVDALDTSHFPIARSEPNRFRGIERREESNVVVSVIRYDIEVSLSRPFGDSLDS